MIDWKEIERIMRRAQRGEHCTSSEAQALQYALKEDRERYKAMHEDVSDEFRAAINPLHERNKR